MSKEFLESIQLPPESVSALQPQAVVYNFPGAGFQLTQKVTLTLAWAGAGANSEHDPRLLTAEFFVMPQDTSLFQVLLGARSIAELNPFRIRNPLVI